MTTTVTTASDAPRSTHPSSQVDPADTAVCGRDLEREERRRGRV